MKFISNLIKIIVPTFTFAAVFFIFLPATFAQASTLYYNNAQNDGDWADLGNWWQNSSDTIPAVALPTSTTDVVITGNVSQISSGVASVRSAYFGINNNVIWNVNSNMSLLTLTASNGVTFNNNSLDNSGIINASTTFNDNSLNNGGTINGTSTFNSPDPNGATVNGNAFFNGLSYNEGTVVGTSTFSYATGGVITVPNGSQWGYGTSNNITGIDNKPITSWIFNGNSFNRGTVTGTSTFNGTSYNAGTVTSTSTFSYATGGVITVPSGSQWGSGGSGHIAGADNHAITSWVFNGTSFNNGTVTGSATFNNASYNNYGATVLGTSTFSYATGGVITIPNGGEWGGGTYSGPIVGIDNNPITTWIFNGNSFNQGTVTGNATFNGTSYDTGTVTGTAQYTYVTGTTLILPTDISWNGSEGATLNATGNPITTWILSGEGENNSTINGNAIFNGKAGVSYFAGNFGTVTGNATFNNYDANISGIVGGNAIFNDYSLNGADVTGNATFNNYSYNIGGIVNGNALFNGLSYNGGTVLGTSTFSYATGGVATIPDGGQWVDGSSGSIVGIDNQPITSWIFKGDLALDYDNDNIIPTLTREYTQNATSTIDFTQNASPWNVIANGATVNIAETTYNQNTVFHPINTGSFTTTPYTVVAPVFTVNPVSSISTSSATIGTTISSIGNEDFTIANGNSVIILYSTSTDPLDDSSPFAPFTDFDGPTTVSDNLTNLISGTTYNYIIQLNWNQGSQIIDSPIYSFVAGDAVLTYIAGTNGTLSGSTTQILTAGENGSQVLAIPNSGYHFVNWSDGSTTNPRTDTNVNSNIFVTANFSNATPPVVSAEPVSSISTTSAVLNATIFLDGGASSTIEGFNYGTTTSYGVIASSSGLFPMGAFSQSITGLVCNTTYHFNAFASSVGGSGTSTDQTFITSSCQSAAVTPTPTVTYSSGGGGGFASPATLATILTPSASATAYINSLTNSSSEITCPVGWICIPPQNISTSQPVISSTTFTRNLTVGSLGKDVKILQEYLNAHGFIIAKTGAGSPGHETTYFGILTKIALSKFQKAHGITPAVGYFGPITGSSILFN